MRHLLQPSGSRVCGQVAVAVLTDKPVEEIYQLVGHKHCTKTRELIDALAKLGLVTTSRCIPATRFVEIPHLALVQVHEKNRSGWHWIAMSDGRVYDGNLPGDISLGNYQLYLRDCGRRITSYLPVWWQYLLSL